MKNVLTGMAVCITLLTAASGQGTFKWTYDTGGDLRSCPAIGDSGIIYVGSKNSTVSAIRPDGTLKWEFETLGTAWHSPAIGADGTIYIGSGITQTNYNAGNRNNFFAINPDGTLKWAVPAGITVESSPAIGPDGTIYLPSSNGLTAYDPDGTFKWNYAAVGNCYSTPAISSDGTIFIGGSGTDCYAIHPNGTLKWSTELEFDVRSSPAIGADGTVYIGAKDNYLYALNPADGTEKWKFNAGSMVLSAPVIDADGVIYFGSYKGKFYAVNPNGTEKWFYQFSEDLGFIENHGSIIGDNGVIYLGASDPDAFYIRKVYALNANGSLKWEYQSSLTIDTPPALANDGTVYIGSADGELLALEGESTGAANSPWPKCRGTAKNTGLGVDTPGSGIGTFTTGDRNSAATSYPNPFVSATTIKYSLNRPVTVTIKVYSVTGAEVLTLFNGEQQAGDHSVVFDASHMEGSNTNTVYLCKIQAGNRVTTSILFQNN